MPATQFLIETGESLKSTVQGKVLVNQEGGVAADGARVLVEDDSIIEVGHSYIFAAREDGAKGHYTVVPVHGHVEVTAVESPASRDKIKKMREAVQNEIDEVPGG